MANIRSPKDARVGETIHLAKEPVPPLQALPECKPMVYAGVYPMDQVGSSHGTHEIWIFHDYLLLHTGHRAY